MFWITVLHYTPFCCIWFSHELRGLGLSSSSFIKENWGLKNTSDWHCFPFHVMQRSEGPPSGVPVIKMPVSQEEGPWLPGLSQQGQTWCDWLIRGYLAVYNVCEWVLSESTRNVFSDISWTIGKQAFFCYSKALQTYHISSIRHHLLKLWIVHAVRYYVCHWIMK